MWKKFNNSYFLRFYSEPQKHSVFVTDFMKIWCNYYTDAQFLDNLKKSNFILVNIDDTELLEKGSRILRNPEEGNVCINTDSSLTISLFAQYGYPFSLNLQLNEDLNELMVTQPLLKSVCDLRMSEQKLILELKKKDKEIEEYKAEGGKIALKHLKTKPFNEETHCSRHRVYKDNFCLSPVPQEILDKQISDIRVKQDVHDSSDIKSENVKIEPVTIKEEPDIEIKNEVIKTELDTQSQSIISPRKSQKRKLKL